MESEKSSKVSLWTHFEKDWSKRKSLGSLEMKTTCYWPLAWIFAIVYELVIISQHVLNV